MNDTSAAGRVSSAPRRAANALVLNRLRAQVDRRLNSRIDRRINRRVDRRVNRHLAEIPAPAPPEIDSEAVVKVLQLPEVAAVITAEVQRQLAAYANRDFTLAVLLGARGHSKRTLTKANHVRLIREVTKVTGVENVDVHITQAFRSLLDAEARGLGRIAGAPYNILGKLVVPPLMALPEGPILEIGTLHGLFAPTLIRSFRRAGQFRHLTVIDPFTGHQMQGGEDIPTDPSGTPVVEDIARWNFAELGLAADDVRIINGFSTDPKIRDLAGDRKYAAVVVDGDHFEDGVAKDLAWVETVLAPGGIAILDDYGDPKWPGVEAATTNYLAGGGKMTMLGTVWTSAFLQLPPS